jgi:hypothetical protein
MAIKKKYVKPLQVVETQEMRDRIAAIAEREEISQAQVCRELHAAAIDAREKLSLKRTGG